MPWVSAGARAQEWPSGTIKIIVPFPPGGSIDPIARIVLPGLQEKLGATIIVENKPGASGSVGTSAAAKSPPDGNTWLFVFDTHSVNPFLMKLNFDTLNDFDTVLLIGTAPNVLAKNPSRPWKSFADVVAAAKAAPSTVTYGSIGSGSVGHLTITLLEKQAGCKFVHVPYRGGGPAMNDAIAGHIDMVVGSAALIVPQTVAKTIVPLIQAGKTRIPSLPDVPTALESGFDNFESYASWGVVTPSGTPKPIIQKFASALAETLREPEINKRIAESFQVTMVIGDAAQQRTFIEQQMALWGPIIKENGITLD